MSAPLVNRILELASPVVEANGAFIIDLIVRGQSGSTVIEVFIDAEGDVTAELCAAISRELSRVMDGEESVPRSYHLVVSSPGADRPLKLPRQYHKHLGRRLLVKQSAEGGTECIEGTLGHVSAKGIALQVNGGQTRELAFDQMLEAKVLLPW